MLGAGSFQRVAGGYRLSAIGYRLLVFLVFTFHLSTFTLNAQSLPLSETATASVLTCGPGNDFYTTFGHSAIRICDTAEGLDMVYNYGMFDFNTPNFYCKFMRGQLDYHIGRTTFDGFLMEYEMEGRAVWEQQLDFTPQEVSNLYLTLEWNYEPENRHYRYDFFRKNCATMVWDRVAEACGKKKVESGAWRVRSYRDYLHMAMREKLEWWALGVDLLLGLSADHPCTAEEAMFYPEVMMTLLENSTRDGKPFVVAKNVILKETREPLSRSFPPLVVFSLVFALIALLTVSEKRFHLSPIIFHLIDRVLFILAGLIGLFLLFMWFGTNHYCTEWNLNILWASPLLLLIAIRLGRSPRWALWLQEVCFAVAVVWVIWCGLSVALIPLILTLALRVGSLMMSDE
jgi:hypothetical protein